MYVRMYVGIVCVYTTSEWAVMHFVDGIETRAGQEPSEKKEQVLLYYHCMPSHNSNNNNMQLLYRTFSY